jgi:hypothetical protein
MQTRAREPLLGIIALATASKLEGISPYLARASSPISGATGLSATKLVHGLLWLAELPVLARASIKACRVYGQ